MCIYIGKKMNVAPFCNHIIYLNSVFDVTQITMKTYRVTRMKAAFRLLCVRSHVGVRVCFSVCV